MSVRYVSCQPSAQSCAPVSFSSLLVPDLEGELGVVALIRLPQVEVAADEDGSRAADVDHALALAVGVEHGALAGENCPISVAGHLS